MLDIQSKEITNSSNKQIFDEITKLLNIFEIKKIVSIDDGWVKKGDIQVDKDDNIEKFINGITEPDFREDIKRIRNNEDIATVQELINIIELDEISDSDCNALKRFYGEYVNLNEDTKEPALKILKELLDSIKHQIPEIEIYTENKQIGKEDIEKYSGQNTLFILDRNMSDTQGDKDAVLDSILELKRYDGSNLVLIYSHECNEDFKNHNNKIKLLEEKDIKNEDEKISILYQLWAINKTGDYEELTKLFAENLYNCAYGKSLYNILNARQMAIRDVLKEIKTVDIESYIPMFEAAYIEGTTILSGYSKMIDALYNKSMENKYYNEIKESYKFLINFEKRKILNSNEINEINSNNKYTKFRGKVVKEQVRNISKNSEMYRIANYSINRLYKDISLGDIIQYTNANNEENFGLVISRECDCVIRKEDNVRPPSRKLEEFTIIHLEHKEIDEGLIDKVDKDYFLKNILPIKFKDKIYSLRVTEQVKQIKSFILDLCSLDENGQAKVEYNDEVKQYKSFHSEFYFGNDFKNKIQTELQMYEAYNEFAKEEKMDELKNKIISYNYGIEFKNNEFNIQRICRLEVKRALLIIQNYIHSISLVGTETPISNEVLEQD